MGINFTSQSSSLHVAIIMDGNGRWASARSLPRLAGHKRGVEALRATVEAAPSCGIATLTFYAFSADNWKRPPAEVNGLMQMFRGYLRRETARLAEAGVRLSVIGRRDRLAPDLVRLVEAAEARTRDGTKLHARLAVDYSSRDMLLEAALRTGNRPTRAAFAEALGMAQGGGVPAPDVDLLIRTGGEQRLSDFLLWESAYAELYFLPCMWPEFTAADLRAAVRWYEGRERRFGALPAA